MTDKKDNRDELDLEGENNRKIAILMIANYMPPDTGAETIYAQTCRLCSHFEGGDCSFAQVCRRNALFKPVEDFDKRSFAVISDLSREIRQQRKKGCKIAA